VATYTGKEEKHVPNGVYDGTSSLSTGGDSDPGALTAADSNETVVPRSIGLLGGISFIVGTIIGKEVEGLPCRSPVSKDEGDNNNHLFCQCGQHTVYIGNKQRD